MRKVRKANDKDKKQFQELWKICFGDSAEFCNWFFTNRFVPEYSVCMEEKDVIQSCMQSYPVHLNVRGQLVKSALLCGVSTHPNARKKGYMSEIFTYMMLLLQKEGIVLAPHTPAVLESYYSFGHYPVCDTQYLIAEKIPHYGSKATIVEIKMNGGDFGGIYSCYYKFSQKYSGCVSRTLADFTLKASDYFVDGGRCIAYILEEKVNGYCFFYKTETELLAIETIADSTEAFQYLLEGLFSFGEGLSLNVKLPPNEPIHFDFAQKKVVPKGVMGGVNLPNLLGIIGGETGYTVRIRDKVIPENNGTFDFNGNKTEEAPHLEIEAGRLLQFLLGYRSLKQLDVEKEVVIYDKKAAEELDRLFPVLPCYIIDEY